MDTETRSPVLAAGQRRWRPCLINGATSLVLWLGLSLLFIISTFALSVTRFPPGSKFPNTPLAFMVVPDPAGSKGTPRVLKPSELTQFRSEYPGGSLAMLPGSSILEPEPRRTLRSYRVSYSARDVGGAGTEMTVRGQLPFMGTPPGSSAYVMWRYTVSGSHIEPMAMVSFNPFTVWFSGILLGFFVAFAVSRVLEKLLIDRPMAQGRWCFLPPLNRDWLVSRGVPYRFDPVPPDLDALATALRAAGATVDHQIDQEALRSKFGQHAVLTVNLRKSSKLPTVLEALIDGGQTPFATLLLMLVAPVSALSAIAMLLLCLLDPFAAWTDSAAWIAGLLLLAAASACSGWLWLKQPGITDQGNRLAMILLDTLTLQGSHSVPPPNWPKLKPPMSQWRRRLQYIFFGMLLLGSLAPFLLKMWLSLFY